MFCGAIFSSVKVIQVSVMDYSTQDLNFQPMISFVNCILSMKQIVNWLHVQKEWKIALTTCINKSGIKWVLLLCVITMSVQYRWRHFWDTITWINLEISKILFTKVLIIQIWKGSAENSYIMFTHREPSDR